MVEELVAKHDCLNFNDRGKVHCSITSHDLVADPKIIEAHLTSKNFKKQQDW